MNDATLSPYSTVLLSLSQRESLPADSGGCCRSSYPFRNQECVVVVEGRETRERDGRKNHTPTDAPCPPEGAEGRKNDGGRIVIETAVMV